MNRETLLARRSIKATDTVTLGEDATVKIRKLSQAEVEHLRKHYGTPDRGLAGMRYAVCVATLNDDGTQMFTEADMADLAGLDFDDINTIATAIGKFSGTAGPNA